MQKAEATKKSYQQWKEHPPHDELPLLHNSQNFGSAPNITKTFGE